MSLLDGVFSDVGGLLDGPVDEPLAPTTTSLPSDRVTSTPRTATTTANSNRTVATSRSSVAGESHDDDDSDDDDVSDDEDDDDEKEGEEAVVSERTRRSGSATPTTNRALASTTNSASATSTISTTSASNAALASVPLPSVSANSSFINDQLSTQPNITSGSSVYPATWTKTTSESFTISTLIIAGPAVSASLAENNRAIRDENIFHTHNKLFPLAVIAVIVACLFFLMTAAFFLIRILGWNKKRRARRLTPSFYIESNTTFEPKFDMAGNVDSTGPYNPIGSTVDLHRNRSQSTVGSGQAIYNVAATLGPASTLPSDRYNEGQPYDGAFFPSPQDNPFLEPGEHSTAQPDRTLLASSSPPSQQTQASRSVEELGSPVPSFNTGPVYAQVDPHVTPAIGIPARGLGIPPPYQTPPARSNGLESNGVDLHDEYKFNMLTREPSNGSNLMSRTRAMNAGVRQIGSTTASGWQEGRRGDGRKSEDEESIIESYVSSSKVAKKPTWGSDRI